MSTELPTTPIQVAINYQETAKKVNVCTEASRNLLKNSSTPELRNIAVLEGGTGSDDEVEALRQLSQPPESSISPSSSPVRKT